MMDLETLVLSSTPDQAPDVAAYLSDAPADDLAHDLADDLAGAEAPSDLISLDAFATQWAGIHDMLGGMVAMRSGNPCPLGDQARSDGGMMACRATYGLLSSSPALSRMFLSESSTFMGSLFVVGMHGFACVQIVRASRGVNQARTSSVNHDQPAAA